MPAVIDIALLLVFVVIVLRNWIAGFFKSIMSVARLIISVMIAFLFGDAAARWLHQNVVSTIVFRDVSPNLTEMASRTADSSEAYLNGMSQDVDPTLLQSRIEDMRTAAGAIAEEYSSTLSEVVSSTISTVLGYVLAFILAFAVISLFIWGVSLIIRISIIRKTDRILGLTFGIIAGYFAVTLLASVMYGVLRASNSMAVYESSVILRLLCQISLFRAVPDRMFGWMLLRL